MAGRPSRNIYHWPKHGRYREFPDFTTTPQQDVSKPRQATKIHPVTDQRAQPLPALVQVNMHHHKVRTLPPKDASTEEVREYLYFVLGCDRFSYTAEEAPEAVTTTIIAYCTLNGQELRDMFKHKLWNEWCPAQWLSIYNTIHENTPKQRKAIGRHLRKAILPLIKAEEKAEAEAGAREARVLKTKELEAETEATKEVKAQLKLLRKGLATVFCFGEGDKRSDSPPPPYVEKVAMSGL